MERETLLNILTGQYGEILETHAMWQCIASLGIKPFKDGNMWCYLYGDNIQEGICGFGETIYKAAWDFYSNIKIEEFRKEIAMANTKIIDCTTCKYGYENERLGIPMCHHPKRFSEDCVNFNMYEEKEIKESEKPINLDDAMKELDEKIALVKERGTWDGVDVDKYMDEVRGREPEKPMNLEEEIHNYNKERFDEYFPEQDGDFISEVDFMTCLDRVARHFAQWQREQMMKEGLDAVKSGQSDKIEKTIAGVFVKYGMDKQKEIMMKGAVEKTVVQITRKRTPVVMLTLDANEYKDGDKVKVIICKKEG